MEHVPKIDWDKYAEHEVLAGLYGKFMHTKNTSIVRWRFRAGSELPEHNHPHEQISMLISGELKLKVGEEVLNLEQGDIVPIPSNVPHGGVAITEAIVIDVFTPIREDFVEKFG